ncbi:hypothetical protein E2P81_ATG02772 [Venturia nashicola]|nr:hypothetical protein E2P81_ATG02772 [Venturia nashicola]
MAPTRQVIMRLIGFNSPFLLVCCALQYIYNTNEDDSVLINCVRFVGLFLLRFLFLGLVVLMPGIIKLHFTLQSFSLTF